MQRAALVLMLLFACDKTPEARPTPPVASGAPTSVATATPPAPSGALPEIPTRFSAAERLVAIGDVHGDLAATKAALRLAGLIDGGDAWAGGTTVLVQTGDMLDRGDDERAILDLFERLQREAKEAGGAVHVLHGNHELMNVAGDFRYVTPGGFADFADVPLMEDSALSRVPSAQRPRASAFFPGGRYARKLAAHPVVVVVGDTVFAHGGVLPHDAAQIERINAEVASWLLGRSTAGAKIVSRPDSPVWSRHFSDEPDESDCQLLDQSLSTLKVARMVVGHTPQKTIAPACDEKVWRVDVGMAAHYGGTPQALEITADGLRVLRE
jgi:hypothetical protein